MKSSPLIRTTTGFAVALGLLPAVAIERSKGEGAERLPTESLPKNEEIAVEKKVAWLGVLTEPLSADLSWHLKLDSGVIVRVVDPNSPAAEAGVLVSAEFPMIYVSAMHHSTVVVNGQFEHSFA